MRYRLSVRVEGELHLDSPITVQDKKVIYEFIPGKNGFLKQIAVSSKIDASKAVHSLKRDESSDLFKLTIGGDKEVHDNLIRKLQSLESQMSIGTDGALAKVFWENPVVEYITESEEDAKDFLVTKSSIPRFPPFPCPETKLSPDRLQNLVSRLATFEDLDLPIAFWREGLNEMRGQRFISAFYNFYYVIEGFCAKGKSSKKSVLNEFNKSAALKRAVTFALEKALESQSHKDPLRKMFGLVNTELNTEGALEFLYEIRGMLHHISFETTREQGTPFNQQDFASLAVFSQAVARALLEEKAKELKEAKDL
ncbi:MAG: hypothetical protein DWG76_04885 [Chloroflexi bacterium]|nr:hypothetical protein [Chloroflexota bacterium]